MEYEFASASYTRVKCPA